MEEIVKDRASHWLLQLLNELNGDLSNQLWQYFVSLFMSPFGILDDPLILGLQRICAMFALTAMPALVGFQVLQRLGRLMDGSSTLPPEVIIRRTLTAGVSVGAIGLWGWASITLTDLLLGVIAAFGLDISRLHLFFTHQAAGTTLAFLMLIFLVAAALLWIQAALLAVEFSLLMIGGPLAALSLVFEDDPGPWRAWKQNLVAVCLTRVVQMTILLIFARRFIGVGTPSGGQLLESVGWLVAVWMQPRWIRSFTTTTGLATFATGAARTAIQVAVFRQVAKMPGMTGAARGGG